MQVISKKTEEKNERKEYREIDQQSQHCTIQTHCQKKEMEKNNSWLEVDGTGYIKLESSYFKNNHNFLPV
jgi:hypothetical protein